MIKKIIALLFLFLSLNIIIILNDKTKLRSVFDYHEDNISDYQVYTLNCEKINLSTKNFDTIFNNNEIEVLGIYPFIDPLYANKIKDKVSYYSFVRSNNKDDIDFFAKYYLEILSDNGLNTEKEKIYFNGIKIKKVKVYTSNYVIKKLITKYHNITP